MKILFLMGVMATAIMAGTTLIQARQRVGGLDARAELAGAPQREEPLGELWYGLVPVGAGAALVAFLVQMGAMLAYAGLAGLPAEMTRAEAVARWDVLLLNTALFGVTVEATKIAAVELFNTRLSRGDWPLFGLAVGAGAGIVQAVLVLGAASWTTLTTSDPVGVAQLWLLPQHVALVAMETALGGMALYRAAQGHRGQALLLAGGLHAVALTLPAVLAWSEALAPLVPALRTIIYAVAAAVAGVTLRHWVRRHGWPF